MELTEEKKLNNLAQFEEVNGIVLEVGSPLEMLAEDYDVVNCTVTRLDRSANKFWITREGSETEEAGCVIRCQPPSDEEEEEEW